MAQPRLGEIDLWGRTSKAIAPRKRMTPLEFGERHRVYGKESRSARWRSSATPWARGILDALSDASPFQRIVAPKGTQLGFTELGLIWIGQGCIESQSALIIEPTDSVAKKVVRGKFRPMLLSTPALREVFSPRALNAMLHFESPTVDIMFAGSNSPTNFASVTVPRFFGDEIDRWDSELAKEGDPLDLAANRIADYGFLGKMFLPCSPTVDGISLVWRAWLESDQRIFETPCPCCGHLQQWLWQNMTWTPGEPTSIKLRCVAQECRQASPEADWKGAWQEGRWRATNPKPIRKDTVGFHLSTLYGRLGGRTWSQICQQYEAVVASGLASRMQTFYNTILGLPWKVTEDAPSVEELRSRLEADMARGVVPFGGLALTCGVDYQRNRLEAHVWAVGPMQETWLVDIVHVPRRTADDQLRPAKDIAADLKAAVLDVQWPHALGGKLKIEMTAHDVSDHPADAFEVIAHLEPKRNIGVRGLAGWGQTARFLPPKIMDVHRNGKVVMTGRLWGRTHTAEAKRDFYEDLKRPTAEDGPSDRYVHFGTWVDEEQDLLRQAVAEEIRYSTRGKPAWVKVFERNEVLDCAILARYAAWHMKAHTWKPTVWTRRAEIVATEVEPPAPPEGPTPEPEGQSPAPAAPRDWIGQAPKGWLD